MLFIITDNTFNNELTFLNKNKKKQNTLFEKNTYIIFYRKFLFLSSKGKKLFTLLSIKNNKQYIKHNIQCILNIYDIKKT